MKTYEIELSKSSLKELKKIATKSQIRILKSIHQLGNNPRKGAVRPMVGSTSWRLRVGNYRVVYDIKDTKLTVLIIRIRHRKDVYRK